MVDGADGQQPESAGAEQTVSKGASRLQCPKCGRNTMRRVSRVGFMQKRIYSSFGYYPWECNVCGHAKLYKNRGERRSRHRHSTSWTS